MGQKITFVEHPTRGDSVPVICICHELKLDSYLIFDKINIVFLIIETEQQLIIAEELKKEIKCKIFYIFLSDQKIKHKHFLFYCNKFTDDGRTYFYKNYNQILNSKIFSKINS